MLLILPLIVIIIIIIIIIIAAFIERRGVRGYRGACRSRVTK